MHITQVDSGVGAFLLISVFCGVFFVCLKFWVAFAFGVFLTIFYFKLHKTSRNGHLHFLAFKKHTHVYTDILGTEKNPTSGNSNNIVIA